MSQGGYSCVGAAILLAQVRSVGFLILLFFYVFVSEDPIKSSVVSVGSERSIISISCQQSPKRSLFYNSDSITGWVRIRGERGDGNEEEWKGNKQGKRTEVEL